MRFFFWTKYPFVQVGCAFLIGNALAYASTDLPDFLLTDATYKILLYAAALLGLGTLLLLGILYRAKKRTALNSILLLLFFVGAGSIRFLTYDERHDAYYLSHLEFSQTTALLGEVVSEPEIKNNKVYVVLETKKVQDQQVWKSCHGKVKITFIDLSAANVSLGQWIRVTGAPAKPDSAATPYDFNYAAYLALQNIHYTLYCKQVPVILPKPASYLFLPKRCAIQVKKSLEHLLKQQLKAPKTLALVTGLLIGKRSDLSEEDKQLFTNSGTIHILAVSGMHVVLIYQALAWIALCFRIKTQHYAFNIILLLLIWFYIFITGLQASASRAAIMISIVLIGKIVQRENQNTNSLLATAFLMLLYNPYYIADVGFILSFLAVAGILLSSSASLPENTNKFWKHILSASLISTAAQISTFPYSVHLFHQFPVYFLLANLLVVPLSTLLLLLSILLLLVCYLPLLPELIVFTLNTCTNFLFYFLQLLNQLPLHTISSISLSSKEMLLLYVLFMLCLLMMLLKNIRWLWAITACAVLLCLSLHYRMIFQFHHPALLISGTKENRQYLFSAGHDVMALQCDSIPSHNNTVDLFLTDHFIRKSQTLCLSSQSMLTLQVAGKSIGIYRKKPHEIFLNDVLTKKCDILVLDYATKYAYLDPRNNINSNATIFSLYRKKSFYKNMLNL